MPLVCFVLFFFQHETNAQWDHFPIFHWKTVHIFIYTYNYGFILYYCSFVISFYKSFVVLLRILSHEFFIWMCSIAADTEDGKWAAQFEKEKSFDRWKKDNISKVLNTSNHNNNNGRHTIERATRIDFLSPPSIVTIGIFFFCHFFLLFIFCSPSFGEPWLFYFQCLFFFFGKRFTRVDKIFPFFLSTALFFSIDKRMGGFLANETRRKNHNRN